jgi:hypothetical protein
MHKKPGISYVVTDGGLELPVIDVSHPAFALEVSEGDLAAAHEQFLREVEQQKSIPEEKRAEMMRHFLDTSLLGRGLAAASGTFLTGLNTYLLKLGPDNLPDGAGAIDLRIADGLPAMALRLRLQDVVRLQAGALVAPLQEHPGRPLHLINIAGGPSVDSLNTLALLRRDYPSILDNRAAFIHDFDGDTSGPDFGAKALAAWKSPGGPLEGADVTFRRVEYNWRDTSTLVEELSRLDLRTSVWAAASEGGLFEYGADEDVVKNLAVLRAIVPSGPMVGSVTRVDGAGQHMRGPGSFALIPRTLEGFTALATRAGWRVETAITGPISLNVRMV